MRGLDKRLTDKINIPFHIAEDPLYGLRLYYDNIYKKNMLLQWKNEKMTLYK